jgi:hypothetical protein
MYQAQSPMQRPGEQIRGPSIDKQLRETYQGGVEGGTVARPVLILELLVRHERICGCVDGSGGHV